MDQLSKALLLGGGMFNLGFVIFHLFFWKLFRWKVSLACLDPVNRAILRVLNLCLTFLFLVMAYVSFFHAEELLSTSLGTVLLISFSLFWILRMIEQVVFFDFKNRISRALTVIFLLGSAIYALPLLVR